jgi:hypothetical protein
MQTIVQIIAVLSTHCTDDVVDHSQEINQVIYNLHII